MLKVFLVPHELQYARSISELSSEPEVKDALGLTEDHTSLKGTEDFINFILEQEKLGKQYSRVILNEDRKVTGVITLKDINRNNQTSHMGTWIGHPYWGKGYNQIAKKEMLYTAYFECNRKGCFS
ncbi:GNAT family N-acetyltransferase [Siminovitchia sp. FSL H7-0308]|uniref:GNAT family N-acetyltransferase n=1 Tax=Siminovitchia sp. FSL H7-0308 TaxID=2921432 RepID=UPI0030EC8EC1